MEVKMNNKIVKKIDLKAPISRVWKALTDYKEFGQWFCVKIEGPFVVGQPACGYLTYPGYENLRWEVQVKQMETEKLFSYTWHPYAVDPSVDYSTETPTLVEFRLEEIPDGTRLTVIESGFDKIPDHRRSDAMRMNDGGWEEQLQNIERYVGAST